jgi:DNA modification methylase
LSKSDKYYFDHVAIKEPSVNPESYKGRRKRSSMTEQSEIIMDKFGATRSGFKNIEEGKTYPTRNKRDVWTVNVRPYKGAHFATYPTALIEPCIKAGSRVNDIVFDPFMGSGTTAQVAKQLGRQYLGCELNPEYEKLQQERINNG